MEAGLVEDGKGLQGLALQATGIIQSNALHQRIPPVFQDTSSLKPSLTNPFSDGRENSGGLKSCSLAVAS